MIVHDSYSIQITTADCKYEVRERQSCLLKGEKLSRYFTHGHTFPLIWFGLLAALRPSEAYENRVAKVSSKLLQ